MLCSKRVSVQRTFALFMELRRVLYQGATLVVPKEIKRLGALAPVEMMQGLKPGSLLAACVTTEVVT